MKKFKCFVAALLCVGVTVSAAAFTACSNSGDGGKDGGDTSTDGGITTDDVQNMIKNEETWKNAFSEIDNANYTVNISGNMNGLDFNGYVKITADGNACQVGEFTMGSADAMKMAMYTVKTEFNEEIGYTEYTDYNYVESEGWDISTSVSEGKNEGLGSMAYYSLKGQTAFDLKYGDYFNNFTFDKEISAYSYDGVIEGKTTLIDFDESKGQFVDVEFKVTCKNNVVTVKDNKIVKIKCLVSIDGFLDGSITDVSYEYYDFGKTVVTVPQEAIDAEKAKG